MMAVILAVELKIDGVDLSLGGECESTSIRSVALKIAQGITISARRLVGWMRVTENRALSWKGP